MVGYLQGKGLFARGLVRGPGVPLDCRQLKDGDLHGDVVSLFVQFLVFVKSIKLETEFKLSCEVPKVFLRREIQFWRLAVQFSVGVHFTRLRLHRMNRLK